MVEELRQKEQKKVPRKAIDQEKGQTVVSLFTERPQVLSPRKFLEANFHALNDGSRVEDVHKFLVNNDIDVGSLAYFRRLWGEVKKKQKNSQPGKLSHAERAMSTTEANNQLSMPMPKPAPQATASVAEDATLDKASSPALSAFSENLKEGNCQQDKAASTITTTPVQKTASIQKSEDVGTAKETKRPLLYGERPIIREDGSKINIDKDGKVTFPLHD